jgi:hypothetical protein
MADPAFMKHLDFVRENYEFTERTTEDCVNALQHSFDTLGRMVQANSPQGWLYAYHLRSITVVALDGMNLGLYAGIFDEIADLHSKKNAGYAGYKAVDPWANFRMAETFGVSAFVGCLIRMTDKFIRIKNLTANPRADQVNESLKDTFYDLAIYAMIALCLHEEMTQQEPA